MERLEPPSFAIIDDLNRQIAERDAAFDRICAEVSDDTAKVLLELARGLTGSPLGTGDGNVIRAQRILENRLGKTIENG